MIPRLEVVRRLVAVLRDHDLVPALGGSGLLVALGLAEVANDWDVTVDAGAGSVAAALDAGGFGYRESTGRDGVFATACRYVVDGTDHEIDLLVGFALRGPGGVEPLPTRVTGSWRGLPLGDPAVWARAYRLLGRRDKSAILERWLAAR